MKYTISIDWLALYCLCEYNSDTWCGVSGDASTIDAPYPWGYKLEQYGTRQFAKLTRVTMPNPTNGRDDFAEVQSAPYQGNAMNRRAVIVRFVNRVLYMPDFWDLANKFIHDNQFIVQSISRIDICADFNRFAHMPVLDLIEGFASKKYRHVGRGVGALYFNHGVAGNPRQYGVRYTGLSFGTHSSDARVYLYNKSFELMTQGDKPWIKDLWKANGLNIAAVWRLEISLKSKAAKFMDKDSGEDITITPERIQSDTWELSRIYHTFRKKLFAFVRNHPNITNITREPRLPLFDDMPSYNRYVLRNVSASDRLERMVIKALYNMGDLYRGDIMMRSAEDAKMMADNLAVATDLSEWYTIHKRFWGKDTHK